MVQYSEAVDQLISRAQARGSKQGQALIQQMQSVAGVTRALEGVILNRNLADTEAAHIKKVHQAGERLARALGATRDRGTEALNLSLGDLSQKLRVQTGLRPPEGVAEVVHQTEVRQALLAMKPEQRAAVVNDALKSKDVLTLNALTNGAAYLSGVEPERIKAVTDTYTKQVAPELVDKIDSVLEIDAELQAAIRAAERAAVDARDESAMRKIVAAEAAAGEADRAFGVALQG